METPRNIPEYTPPDPSRLQKLAMKAAGMLMRQKTPADTLERLTVDVGGYEADDNTFTGERQYRADVKPDKVAALRDETTPYTLLDRYRSGADFHDAKGTNLETAASHTLKGLRKEGEKAKTLRGRTARRLANYGSKGVGVHAFLK